MRKVEVLFLIDGEGRVLWFDASTSPVKLPDRRDRWEAIWERREVLAEISHSHPLGPLAFSQEDEQTMAAITAGLGRSPVFSVVAPSGMLRRIDGRDERVEEEPWWASLLRRASGAVG
ncbi:MAG: hypothetical protein RMJ98_00825 [Myxococcales bacterium]|nr:hypothetical protein [Polyangiaceae bacterium]MDW8247829.1 hypothetical protein [Myxococcales bacterium]